MIFVSIHFVVPLKIAIISLFTDKRRGANRSVHGSYVQIERLKTVNGEYDMM